MVLRTICNNKADVKEHMAVSDEIKNEIKAIYNADVTAIQNLSDIANKLQTGGYTCPGDYSVTGVLKVKNRDILAELDALNNKTRHMWTNDGTTFFTKGIYITGNVVTTGEMCIDNNGHECHFFNEAGIAGIWYHKKDEPAKYVRFSGHTADMNYGTEIKTLQEKTQFITTVSKTTRADPVIEHHYNWNNRDVTTFTGDIQLDQGKVLWFNNMFLGQDNPISVWGGPAGGGKPIQTG